VAPFVVRSRSNVGKTVVNLGLLTLATHNKFGGAVTQTTLNEPSGVSSQVKSGRNAVGI
jgi:hypothetical protein